MAYTTINKSTDYFNTVTYAGDGNTTQAITNTFQTDFSWIKHRGTTAAHTLQDAVRGFDLTKKLSSNTTDAENNASGATWENYGGVSAVGATSFTVSLGSNTPYQTNANGANYVAWNWKANGAGSTNYDGDITSTVSANTTAGFSIVSWTGNATESTIGHGLNSAPELLIVKNRTDAGNDWRVGQTVTASNNMTDGNGYYLDLNDTKASTNPGSAVLWGATPTAPTSSVFTVGTNNGINGSSDNMLAYCFHSVKGFSKIGTYTGNGNADGTFIYTGFKPAFVLLKNTTDASDWNLKDSKRPGYNQVNDILYPNLNNAEEHGGDIDILSNGFKVRTIAANTNNNGSTYIYIAFGQSLVGSNNIPCTAR